ncbi:MAG: cell cycle transcriptional regulator TrcR [Kiloniellales bacterium]|nr:cell cycle transcriptional regulator TrcR [Kiloniellales bacterium]
MSSLPLMPKATAVWLVDNTTLSFEQIAEFCGLHPLEVQGIADNEVAVGIQGLDPISANELTREEIERCEKDPSTRLKRSRSTLPQPKRRTKGPRYTPVAKRQDKPDAIAWVLRHHPELKDSQIVKLIGTTKNTIQAVRDRSHWNTPNIRPRDPVLLGLCNQTDLNAAITKARKAAERAGIAIPEPQIESVEQSTEKDLSDNPLAAFGLPGRND